MPLPIALVHLDESLLVADKPEGLLAVPGRGVDKADSLATRVQAGHPQARVVHRLDMATSGLIVYALGAQSQRRLSAEFAGRRVAKTYVAVVLGLPQREAGEIDLPLAADWPNRPRQRVDADRGRPSLTRWRVLERDRTRGVARIELRPLTGRSHQLRVHLAAIGHPIVGDGLYAPAGAHADPATRLHLHATRLAFSHPADGRWVQFDSRVPF